jgi:predicted acylesterase/phospholipase RssA
MAQTHTKTAIAFQGGGALGAYAFGALKRIYSEPGFRPSCVSGVSIGAFTAALAASHPADPIPKLQARCGEGAGQPAEDSRRSQSGYRAANVTTAYVRKDAHGTMLRNHCSLRDVRQTCKNLFRDL